MCLIKAQMIEFGNEAERAPGAPFSWATREAWGGRGGGLGSLSCIAAPPPPLNPSGLAERPGTFRGIERKRKPLGWRAMAQKLIALRSSSYVCACCQNGNWGTKTKVKSP